MSDDPWSYDSDDELFVYNIGKKDKEVYNIGKKDKAGDVSDELKTYNPLSLDNLGESVLTALEDRDPVPLNNLAKFTGSGVYAIYFTGAEGLYAPLASFNRQSSDRLYPIYAGQASASNVRTGKAAQLSTKLFGRLNDHKKSIEMAEDLEVAHFEVRWLPLEPVWITLGETILIARYAPVWNGAVSGFGNHAPGSGREAGKVSDWDVLHPGRSWIDRSKVDKTRRPILQAAVEEYLRSSLV